MRTLDRERDDAALLPGLVWPSDVNGVPAGGLEFQKDARVVWEVGGGVAPRGCLERPWSRSDAVEALPKLARSGEAVISELFLVLFVLDVDGSIVGSWDEC